MAEASAAQPSGAEPSAAGPNAARPSATGQSATGQSATGQSATGQSATGQSATGPSAAEPSVAPTTFDRDTAVSVLSRSDDGDPARAQFAANVSADWRAGRGPHGGYLAAMLLRALTEAVDDPARAPRSLTIHYARAPQPGPVGIDVTIERQGRSLSSLSARMRQDGALVALALAAFSVAWDAPEIADLALPDVAPPDAQRRSAIPLFAGAPPFTSHLIVQPRIGVVPFQGSDAPMEIGSWLGLAEARPIDALSLAFFSDALFSPPFIRLTEPSTTPTIDLTIHFRTPMPRVAEPDAEELCFARFRTGLVHDGFFEEDGVIWAGDGAVLVQSRQLGIVLPRPIG